MRDSSRLERAIFNWFSRQSDLVAAASPFVIFYLILAVGFLIVKAFDRSPWPQMAFASWLLVVGTFAGTGLYLSTIFAVGAALVRSRRFKLLQLHQTMRDIQAMSWREFEDLVEAYFASEGYRTEHVGRNSADGGVDIVVSKGKETWLVQCKHYRSQWIEEKPLRELLGLVASHRATGGIFVACGVFGDDALAFAKANPTLRLIGGEQLKDLVEDTVRHRISASSNRCPVCGGEMRRAQGRYGSFLGCANFPACKGWRPLPHEEIA